MSRSRIVLSPRVRAILLRIVTVLGIAYGCFGFYIWWAMHQTPEHFGRVMARMPGPVAFLIFPFETAWTEARD